MQVFQKLRLAAVVYGLLLFSADRAQGQTLPPPTEEVPPAAATTATASATPDETANGGMDSTAARTVVERLVILISDSKADPDKRAKACEYLSKFGASGAPAVPAIMGFIEQQLTTGKLRHYFHTKPSSVIIYPAGTAGRLARAVYALGEVGPMAGEAIPLLKKVTVTSVRDSLKSKGTSGQDNNGLSPRALAAEAIGKIGQPESLEVLVALTNNDPHSDTRAGAVKGLAQLAANVDSQTAITASAQLRVIAFTDPVDGIREQAKELLEAQSKKQLTKVVKASSRKKD